MDGFLFFLIVFGKFCGNGSKDVVELKFNILMVLFKLDFFKIKKGFEVYWLVLFGFIEKVIFSILLFKVLFNEVVFMSKFILVYCIL